MRVTKFKHHQSLKKFFTSHKQVINNFSSLFLVQGVNFIIPIVIIPYILHKIGIEKFGIVSIVQVLIGYFIIIADYGFNLKGTRDISLKKDNKESLSHYVSLIIHAKVVLCIICFLTLALIILCVPRFGNEATTCLLGFLMVIGHTFNPVWFFQGIEKMKYITVISILGKLALFALIVLLVRKADDYPYVLLSYGISFMLGTSFGLYMMFGKYGVQLKRISLREIFLELKSGFSYSLSNFSVNMYIHSNVLILGFFTNDTITGIYSIIDKIIYAFRQILVVFFQATYPQMCRLAVGVRSELIRFQRSIFIPFTIIVFIGCILLFFLAPIIYKLMSNGRSDESAILLLQAMSFIPFIIAMATPANQLLLAYDLKKPYAIILISGGLLCIAVNLLLAPRIGMTGTALAVIITELFVTVGLHTVLAKHKQLPILRLTLRKAANN